MTSKPSEITVGAVGAGRMGRGIAIAFVLAGARTVLIDIKKRSEPDREKMAVDLEKELRLDFGFLAKLGLIQDSAIEAFIQNIELHHDSSATPLEESFDIVFEGVPEHRQAKETAFAWMSENFPQDTIIASTTSTFLVDDLATLLPNPARYANAHWLNPAYLMPLVEISKGTDTSEETIQRLRTILELIGKSPIVCGPTPGYIVPRIQALAMNEAARLYEENAASVEDIDKAVRVGFGIRFAILGLLEFIDWGGGDILYYASDYLSKNVDKDRYTAPKIVHDNMHQNRNGVTDGEGFYDYRGMDVDAYRERRLTEFIELLRHMSLLPEIAEFAKPSDNS